MDIPKGATVLVMQDDGTDILGLYTAKRDITPDDVWDIENENWGEWFEPFPAFGLHLDESKYLESILEIDSYKGA